MKRWLLNILQISGMVTLPIGSFLFTKHLPYGDTVLMYAVFVTIYCLSFIGNRVWLNKRLNKSLRVSAVLLMFTPVLVSFIIYPLLVAFDILSVSSALFWHIFQIGLFFICSLLSMIFLSRHVQFNRR